MQIAITAHLLSPIWIPKNSSSPKYQFLAESLHIDLILKIFDLLSYYDQLVITPFVCKKWNLAYKEKRVSNVTEKFFEEPSFKNSHFIQNFKYKLLKTLRINELIPQLLNLNLHYSSYTFPEKVSLGKGNVPVTILYEKGRANLEFNIYWNSPNVAFKVEKFFSWGWNKSDDTLEVLQQTFKDRNTEDIFFSNKDFTFDLSLKKANFSEHENSFLFLAWETNDFKPFQNKIKKIEIYNFGQLLRWMVLAKTANCMAKKMGIEIKLTGEKFSF